MTERVTIGVHEATPSGAPRAQETKLDATTAQETRGALKTMLHIGRDYGDPLTVTKTDGSKSLVYTSDEDAQTLYDAAKVAALFNEPMTVYDAKGKQIGELNPQDVMSHLTKWHTLKE